MIEYQNLKCRYIAAIQLGFMMNIGHEGVKAVNGILHKFCESCVDNSNYSEYDKQYMKNDLELVKEALSQEIEQHFRGIQQ